MTRRQTILTASAVLGFLLILSSIAFGLGINWWVCGHNSQSWSQTNGQLLQLNFLGTRGRGNRIVAEYKFEVDGINYQGSRVRFGGASGDEKELEGLQSGAAVKISFNPKNPVESILIPGVTSGARALTFFGAFGLIVIIAAAASVWFSFRNENI